MAAKSATAPEYQPGPFIIVDHDGSKLDYWRKISIGIVRFILIQLNHLYGSIMHAIWMVLLFPLRLLTPDLYWYLEGVGFHWLLLMVASWQWSAGYTGEHDYRGN